MDISTRRTHLDQPNGHVLVAHGYAEHSGRFEGLINALLQAGYDVSTYDHYGHGTSPGPRAKVDVGLLIKDHIAARQQALHNSRCNELILFGHSMGGLISAASALIYRKDLRCMVLTGPAFIPLLELPKPVVGRLGKLARYLPGVQAPAAQSMPEHSVLSHDPSVQEAFDADPLNYHGAPPRLTLSTMVIQGKKALEHADRLTCPTLIFHGSADELTSPEGSAEFVERVRHAHPDADIHLRVIDGAYHEVLNEPEKDIILRDLLLWLEKH